MLREPRGILRRHVRPRAHAVWSDAVTGALGGAAAVAVVLIAACSCVQPPDQQARTGGLRRADRAAEEITVTGSRIEESAADIRTLQRAPMSQRSAGQAGTRAAAAASRFWPAPSNLRASCRSTPIAPYRSPSAARSARGRALARVQPGEEIWVIAMSSDAAEQAVDLEDNAPGSGTMFARARGRRGPRAREIPLPLKHTDVRAVVSGYVGTVDVKQQFENPYDEKIEAVYLSRCRRRRPSASS